MQYRTLGSTGLRVSSVGIGTWQFSGEWGRKFNPKEAKAILDTARDCGINLVDTAGCYGDHLSESLVGQAIRENREDWIVATKFGHHFKGPFDRDMIFDPKDVVKQLEASLKALQTDYIDLYQFHSGDDEKFDTEGLWETLREQKKLGKIRHLGISISSNENIYQTGKAETVGAEAIQVIYNRLAREPEKEVFPACKKQNLGVLARVPLASGYLSGKYSAETRFPENDVRSRHPSSRRDSQIAAAQRIKREEVPEGIPMARWALAWCLRNPRVSCVIPGCKSPQQVRGNAAAGELS